MATFPQLRLRRTRGTETLRALVRETRVDMGDLVYPLFVVEGKGIKQEIASMPGAFRFSADLLPAEVEEIAKLGIPAVLLFGIPDDKDEVGSQAYQRQGVVQQAIRSIKRAVPELLVVTDVCLCEYTSHGHCGVVVNGSVDNDQTLLLLAQTALSHAEAGADIIAPSDMMDGRVKAIREKLDEAKRAQLLAGNHEIITGRLENISITGDAYRLKQLLSNLVNNAIKYTPDGGTITLSLCRDGEWARLEVNDTGIGIPPEHLPHIFGRFYRVDKARSRAGGGTGLGLAIVRGIAGQHGGKVNVTSTPGKGSTFTVWLRI